MDVVWLHIHKRITVPLFTPVGIVSVGRSLCGSWAFSEGTGRVGSSRSSGTLLTVSFKSDGGAWLTVSFKSDGGALLTLSFKSDGGALLTVSFKSDGGALLTVSFKSDGGAWLTVSFKSDGGGTLLTSSITGKSLVESGAAPCVTMTFKSRALRSTIDSGGLEPAVPIVSSPLSSMFLWLANSRSCVSAGVKKKNNCFKIIVPNVTALQAE